MFCHIFFRTHIFVQENMQICRNMSKDSNFSSNFLEPCALLILLAGFPGAAVLDLFRARNRASAGRVFEICLWAPKKTGLKVIGGLVRPLFGWYRQTFKYLAAFKPPLFVLEELPSTSETFSHTHTHPPPKKNHQITRDTLYLVGRCRFGQD